MNRRSEQPMNRMSRRATIMVAATTVLLLGSTSAYAYWTTLGSGSGAAAARTFTPPTVSSGTVEGPLLYPGLIANGTSTGGTLAMVASNPNPFPVTVQVSQAAGAVTGCTTPAVTFLGGSFTLDPNTSNVSTTLPFTVGMDAGASNDCQGATITVPLATSSTSN